MTNRRQMLQAEILLLMEFAFKSHLTNKEIIITSKIQTTEEKHLALSKYFFYVPT